MPCNLDQLTEVRRVIHESTNQSSLTVITDLAQAMENLTSVTTRAGSLMALRLALLPPSLYW